MVLNLLKNVYSFGFVTKSPLISGNSSKIGGIIVEYLKEFSKLTNAEFKYVAYKNNIKLQGDFYEELQAS